MPISLHDASVEGYRQALDATAGFLDRGIAHLRETGQDTEAVVETRLAPDMQPFRFQVQNVARHAVGGVEAILSGEIGPSSGPAPEHDYAGLQALIEEARATLAGVGRQEIDAREGQEVVFRVPGREMRFTVEGFVLSFSLPNLHFHAATAYGILRAKGVPLGKRDYLGALRLAG